MKKILIVLLLGTNSLFAQKADIHDGAWWGALDSTAKTFFLTGWYGGIQRYDLMATAGLGLSISDDLFDNLMSRKLIINKFPEWKGYTFEYFIQKLVDTLKVKIYTEKRYSAFLDFTKSYSGVIYNRRYGQIIDSLDDFYSDYKNAHVLIGDALIVIRMELEGEPKNEIEEMKRHIRMPDNKGMEYIYWQLFPWDYSGLKKLKPDTLQQDSANND